MTRPTKENPVQSETDGTSRRRSRRQILALGGAAAAAAAVAAVGVNGGKKAEAAPGDLLYVGQVNNGHDQMTELVGNAKGNPNGPAPTPWAVLRVENSAVLAEWGEEANAIQGVSEHGGTGVAGHSATGNGVQGTSDSFFGVVGDSSNGYGVIGFSPGETNPAVVAYSGTRKGGGARDGGVALAVVGKAIFTTAGAEVVPAKADAVAVPNSAVTADSHITVTLTDDPGRASVAWVERDPGTGFTVHMSSRPRSAVPFTYLIVEPGA